MLRGCAWAGAVVACLPVGGLIGRSVVFQELEFLTDDFPKPQYRSERAACADTMRPCVVPARTHYRNDEHIGTMRMREPLVAAAL